MASSEQQQPAARPVIMMSAEQAAAQTIAREMQELRDAGIKLDESVPGGVFEDAPGAGTFHDAHGRPVKEDGTLIVEGRARALAGAPVSGPSGTGGGPEVTDAIKAAGGQDEDYRADMAAQREESAEEGNPNLESDESGAPRKSRRGRK